MSEHERAQLHRALAAMDRMSQRLKQLEHSRHEAIAVVGMACRLPGGASSLEGYWSLLSEGRCGIAEIPADRWDVKGLFDLDPNVMGKMYTTRMGVVEQPEMFDAAAFGIAPREAQMLDPQQRMLLEVGRDALEHAAIAPRSLLGRSAGVFVGVGVSEYARRALYPSRPEVINAYSPTGNAPSAAAGRLSYTFGLRGPALTVDTACSTSLVAVHLAMASLRAGECDLALAGGANAILEPHSTISQCRLHALSPDGLCKTFDASANGYVRAEGCGMVVLKRLSDALDANDPILGVLRGSAVNQDGRSAGLTAPSGHAQQSVIRAALAQAGLAPRDLDYVEAHGTGTPLGDPIELQALEAAIGCERPADSPLVVGSAKTNIGHLESAAGIAALIKVLLCLQHGELPRHLHFTNPNPNVDWENLNLRVQTEHGPWPSRERPRRAGISSFGFTGTNCHVVVEEAPRRRVDAERRGMWSVLPLSAPTATALRTLAGRLADHLQHHPEIELVDACRTAGVGRDHLVHRAACVVGSTEDLASQLRGVASADAFGAALGGQRGHAPKVAVVFSGQGAQYAEMGRGLMRAFPVIRDALERLDACYRRHAEGSILEVIRSGDGLDRTQFTQPALFVLEMALWAQWRAWGLEPKWVCGHSVGEFAAACAAGVFDEEQGLVMLLERARLMDALRERGTMASVDIEESEVRAVIGSVGGRLDIAATNAPRHTVISGEGETVERACARFRAAGVRVRSLKVSHAFHSRLMEPMLDPFSRFVSGLPLRRPEIPLISNLTGQRMDVAPDATYYRRHVREPVRFGESLDTLRQAGVDVVLEIGPHPVLLGLADETFGPESNVALVASLRRGRDDEETLRRALAALYAEGADVAWSTVFGDGQRARLPSSPFERQRYWISSSSVTRVSDDERASPIEPLAEPVGDQVVWVPVSFDTTTPPASSGAWLLVDHDGALQALGAALASRGHFVRSVGLDAAGAALLESRGWRGVVVCPPMRPEDASFSTSAVAEDAADCVRALSALDSAPPLWILTRGAHHIASTDAVAPVQAAWWGLGRSWAAERPDAWGGLIDMPVAVDANVGRCVADVLLHGGEDEVAVRPERVYASRLRPLPAEQWGESLRVRPEASYLVTGAAGAIGGHIAQWLVQQGARHLLLVSRRACDPELAPRWDALRAAGAKIELAGLDVGDVAALRARIEALPSERPLAGIFHAAGTLDDRMLSELDAELFARVLRPKLDGARVIEVLTRGRTLDALVLFSSASSVLGGPGQANYAFANAYLDGFAAAHHSATRPFVSISWGAWSGHGMAARMSEGNRMRLVERGMQPLDPVRAVELLGRAATGGVPHVVVTPMDWAAYRRAVGGSRSLLGERTPDRPLSATPRTAGDVEHLVREHVAHVLGFARPQDVDLDAGFSSLGMDSLTTVELRNRLCAATGAKLPASAVLDYPTIRRMTLHLVQDILKLDARSDASLPAGRETTRDPHEPIAIVGAACRFPGGVQSLEAYWDLLREGVDAVAPVPTERFDVSATFRTGGEGDPHRATMRGGFIDRVDEFDAGFFRIAPREAESLDPQQRLMLEIAWEAFEHAGLPVSTLREFPTGVFVGVGINDYGELSTQADPHAEDPYAITGNGLCFVAGRVSYALGLRGPSLSVDTACSSSLVAVHLACQSLRLGECRAALAGGVHLMLSPRTLARLSRINAFSHEGQCRPFDDAADGYLRGEGAGAIVLKRLADAKADGDRILGVLRGSAINHDGPSSGLTVPSGPAQQALLKAALADAQLAPDDIDAIEAHGTGTTLGDPIEVGAIGAVFAKTRTEARPLWVSSVKANIGHLEATAGIAGLLKMVLALQHGQLLGQVHLETPSRRIAWDELRVAVSPASQPWPAGRTRRGGVSSFGLSGTNAHVVLEAPEPELEAVPPPAAAGIESVLPLSAHCAEALGQSATEMAEWIERPEAPPIEDVCFTASERREHLSHRLVVRGVSSADMALALRAFVAAQDVPQVVSGRTSPTSSGPVFVFSGQGGQWAGMASAMLTAPGVFRSAVEECDRVLRPELGWSVLDMLLADADAPAPERIEVVQPLVFTVQVAIARHLIAAGVAPGAVVGHSMGEVAAAHIAGILDLLAAAQVIARRSRIMSKIRGRGAMALVGVSREEATQIADARGGRLAVAGNNSPRSCIVSGEPETVEQVVAELHARDVFCRRISVDIASHSHQVDALLPELAEAFRGVQPRPEAIPFCSTVSARVEQGESLDAAYWVGNVRGTVEFAAATRVLLERGHRAFIEIGPHPLLVPALRETLDEAAIGDGAIDATLRRGQNDREQLRDTVLRAFCVGAPIDWSSVGARSDRRRVVSLPRYPFQRKRHWLQPPAKAAWDPSMTQGTGHPVIGHRLALPGHVAHFINHLGASRQRYLSDHQVFDRVVVPGAYHIVVALCAAQEQMPGAGVVEIRDVSFHQVVTLEPRQERALHVTLSPDGSSFDFVSSTALVEDASTFVTHCRAKVQRVVPSTVVPHLDRAAVFHRCREASVDAESVYTRLANMNIVLGPSFRWIDRLHRGRWEALAELVRPAALEATDAVLHPTLVDACFQTLCGAAPPELQDTFAPFGVERLRVHGEIGQRMWCHARLHAPLEPNAETMVGDILLFDEQGRCIIEIAGFCSKRADRRSMLRVADDPSDRWLLRMGWVPRARASTASPAVGGYLVFLDDAATGVPIVEGLRARGCDVVIAGVSAHGAPRGVTVDGLDPRGADAAIEAWSRLEAPRGIIDLRAFDLGTGEVEGAVAGVVTKSMHLLQAVLRGGTASVPRVWFVTRGAQRVSHDEGLPHPGQSALWGLVRTLEQEHPDLRVSAVDVDPAMQRADVDTLVAEILTPSPENQLALRGQVRYVARLERPRGPSLEDLERVGFDPDGCILITGGLGGLGLELAQWLADHGVGHLVLAGRRPPSIASRATIDGLIQRGIDVRVEQADVSKRDDVARLVAVAERQGCGLRGVFHLAACLRDATVVQQSAASIQDVLAAKVGGAAHLHALTSALPLDHFVLYSSASALLGSPGQANYAAANAYLDGLAEHRQGHGRPGLSVAWGPFAQVGAAAGDARAGRLWQRGARSLTPDDGQRLLGRVLALPLSQVGVVPLDVRRLLEFAPHIADMTVFEHLLSDAEDAGHDAPRRGTLKAAVEGAPPARRGEVLQARVRSLLVKVIRVEASRIEPGVPFGDLGLDSLMGLEIRNALEVELDERLRISLLWTYPTLSSLCAHLLERIAVQGPASVQDERAEPSGLDAMAELLESELTDAEQWTGKGPLA